MEKGYYITIDGKQVPVTEEVYRAFKRPVWREHKRSQVRKKREISSDSLAESGYEIPSKDKLVDEIVEDKLMLEILIAALDELSEDERQFINKLYYEEKTEAQVAECLGVSQQAVNKRRKNIIKKLKKLL